MIFCLDELALLARAVTLCIDGDLTSAAQVERLKALRRKIRKAVLCKLNDGGTQYET